MEKSLRKRTPAVAPRKRRSVTEKLDALLEEEGRQQQDRQLRRAKLQEAAEHLRNVSNPPFEVWREIDRAKDILTTFDFEESPEMKSWHYAKKEIEEVLSNLIDMGDTLVHAARDLALSPTENC